MAFSVEFEYKIGDMIATAAFGTAMVVDTLAVDAQGPFYGCKNEKGDFHWLRPHEIKGEA